MSTGSERECEPRAYPERPIPGGGGKKSPEWTLWVEGVGWCVSGTWGQGACRGSGERSRDICVDKAERMCGRFLGNEVGGGMGEVGTGHV